MAYLFPTKINPPHLIFLSILPHHCIQRVIKFSFDIDHSIKIDVSSLLLEDHEASHENSCLWKRLVDCINVSWHVHGHLVHGLLYFYAYSKLPCTVQQFATLLGSRCPSTYVHDTGYPNGNNKSPILVDILINFTFLV